jgi:hypothetical protein
MAGRASLPHPCLLRVNQSLLARTRGTPLQLPLSHPWDFPNLGSLSLPHSNRSPPRSQTLWFLRLLSHNLRPSASPLCPTSRLQILLMTSLPSTTIQPRPSTRPSTSRMGTWKFCAGTHCSVSTPASYPSTLLCFARYSLRLVWIRQNHLIVAPASCPRTPPRISPPFSR